MPGEVRHQVAEAAVDRGRRLVVVVEAALDDHQRRPGRQGGGGPVGERDASATARVGAEPGAGEAGDVHLAGQAAGPRAAEVVLAQAHGPGVADHQDGRPVPRDQGRAFARVDAVLLAAGRSRARPIGGVERDQGSQQQHDD